MIDPEKLAKLEEKHPNSIIVGIVNGKTHEKTLLALPRNAETIAKLLDRWGMGEEMHGSVLTVHAPTQEQFQRAEAAKLAAGYEGRAFTGRGRKR